MGLLFLLALFLSIGAGSCQDPGETRSGGQPTSSTPSPGTASNNPEGSAEMAAAQDIQGTSQPPPADTNPPSEESPPDHPPPPPPEPGPVCGNGICETGEGQSCPPCPDPSQPCPMSPCMIVCEQDCRDQPPPPPVDYPRMNPNIRYDPATREVCHREGETASFHCGATSMTCVLERDHGHEFYKCTKEEDGCRFEVIFHEDPATGKFLLCEMCASEPSCRTTAPRVDPTPYL